MNSLESHSPDTIAIREEAGNYLSKLRSSMMELEHVFAPILNIVHPNYTLSARNLLHYLLLRSEEIRPLQHQLHELGLSSLTSSESHTLYQVNQVLKWLGQPNDQDESDPQICTFDKAIELRNNHLVELLGENPQKDIPHIMVTLSPEVTDDAALIEALLLEGMTIVRINCAHDNPEAWAKMINTVKNIGKAIGRDCKIYMDLAGPRIRVSDVKTTARTNQEGLQLKEGDLIELTGHKGLARRAHFRRDKSLKSPARIVVQPASLTSMMQVGERIFFDDGKFEARIVRVAKESVVVQVTRISTRNPTLKIGKGVNLPDSQLRITSLTEEDLIHLPFIARHADLVGYSFVSTPEDVQHLRSQLKLYKTNAPAIILKIERLAAVENLPALLFEGMRDKSFGVMIARGDLAVEIGFERLSEVQQQILWISEAAHVPVIWATQVLEHLNKSGFATRSEITDAAMSSMAECVMLNKGKHVVKTVQMLVDILTRFSMHSDKKRFTFRPLSIARNFVQGRG